MVHFCSAVYKRVAVGRTIVRDPNVFLFDEPLSNLDAKLRLSTRAELKALQRSLDTTTIYVTHDQAEAMTLGDRICVMYKGRVQQVAKPMELYEKPANKFVAGFLGTRTINFFDGKIEFKDDNVHFIIGGTAILLPHRMKCQLGTYQDRDMVLGIRPEHLSFEPFADQSENVIRAAVDVVEILGDRMDVYLTAESGYKFIAKVGTHIKLKAAEAVKVYIDVEKVLAFEPSETGVNVTP